MTSLQTALPALASNLYSGNLINKNGSKGSNGGRRAKAALPRKSLRRCICRSQIMSSPEFYQVERLLGTYSFMDVTSYSSPSFGGLSSSLTFKNSIAELPEIPGGLRSQNIDKGNVQIRLYSGRISQGQLRGLRVLFKVYPGKIIGGKLADILAANELATHLYLQEMGKEVAHQNIQVLLGGFETSTGEQWLVFRDNGRFTADRYAKLASEATTKGSTVGGWELWDIFDKKQIIRKRCAFIIKLLQGVFTGLAYMHANDRLHQSLGPASVTLNTSREKQWDNLEPRLRDLAFSIDLSKHPCSSFGYAHKIEDPSFEMAVATLSEGLWRRATSAGAFTPLEKKAFGIADDIYAGGLLLAYMSFVPLCQEGSIDGPSLQRLLEATFQLDIQSAREYCESDDRWSKTVCFLDQCDKAGWELLQAMLNPDYRQRPTAEAVLKHRFMTQEFF